MHRTCAPSAADPAASSTSTGSRAGRRSPAALAAALAAVATLALGAGPATAAPAPTVSPEARAAAELGVSWVRTQQRADGSLSGFGADWVGTGLAAAGVNAADLRTSPGAPSFQDYWHRVWTSGDDGPEGDWIAPSGRASGDRPATDYERALIVSHSIGLQPTRLSADQNLVAQLAGLYNGRPAGGEEQAVKDGTKGRLEGSLGNPALFNGTIFGLLALADQPVPKALIDTLVDTIRSNQHTDGGWDYQRVLSNGTTGGGARGRASDLDMTGSGVAALCIAGLTPDDPTVAKALGFLESKLVPATGAFGSPFGANTDSNGWAVSGLNACGVDPEGADWTTAADRTPIDFLLSQQRTAESPRKGSFKYLATESETANPNLYATQDAIRALAGGVFSPAPPTRADGSGPLRPAPTVADGTVVPQAIAIDAGVDATGERDLRFCRVYAPSGASVATLLQKAATDAQPAGCVTGLATSASGDVEALNGVTGTADRRWVVSRDGAPTQRAGRQPACFGQILSLSLAADGASPVSPTCGERPTDPTDPTDPGTPGGGTPGTGGGSTPGTGGGSGPGQSTGGDTSGGGAASGGGSGAPAPTASTPSGTSAPEAALVGASSRAATRTDARGRIVVRLRCPRTAGAAGCRTTLVLRAKVRRTASAKARTRTVGRATVRLAAGKSRTVKVRPTAAARRDLRRRALRVTVAATTRVDGRTAPRRTSTVRLRRTSR